jgi:hypothetical protein
MSWLWGVNLIEIIQYHPHPYFLLWQPTRLLPSSVRVKMEEGRDIYLIVTATTGTCWKRKPKGNILNNKSKKGESYKWIREVVEEVVGVKQEYYTYIFYPSSLVPDRHISHWASLLDDK